MQDAKRIKMTMLQRHLIRVYSSLKYLSLFAVLELEERKKCEDSGIFVCYFLMCETSFYSNTNRCSLSVCNFYHAAPLEKVTVTVIKVTYIKLGLSDFFYTFKNIFFFGISSSVEPLINYFVVNVLRSTQNYSLSDNPLCLLNDAVF
jgi:hypothetical protein